MTMFDYLPITCVCKHEFWIDYPRSITTWLYPNMVQDLLDGKYYKIPCPACEKLITIEGKTLVNTPRGIVLIPVGPPEEVKKYLSKLEVCDGEGIPFSSKEIRERLQNNRHNQIQ